MVSDSPLRLVKLVALDRPPHWVKLVDSETHLLQLKQVPSANQHLVRRQTQARRPIHSDRQQRQGALSPHHSPQLHPLSRLMAKQRTHSASLQTQRTKAPLLAKHLPSGLRNRKVPLESLHLRHQQGALARHQQRHCQVRLVNPQLRRSQHRGVNLQPRLNQTQIHSIKPRHQHGQTHSAKILEPPGSVKLVSQLLRLPPRNPMYPHRSTARQVPWYPQTLRPIPLAIRTTVFEVGKMRLSST